MSITMRSVIESLLRCYRRTANHAIEMWHIASTPLTDIIGTAEAIALMNKVLYNIASDGCKTIAEYAEKLRKARDTDNLAAFGRRRHVLSNPTQDEDGIDVKVTTLQGVIAAT
ncbi:hypothetical protein E4U31_007393 [Claviceps sp. LM219 group G6]|nr:hypothetical protein E4U31_007393 [Claviceps sp. LM219 group G6]